MDPFTERILERARERQKKLKESHNESTLILKESNMKDDGNLTVSPSNKFTNLDSNVHHKSPSKEVICKGANIDVKQEINNHVEKENQDTVREDAKKKLQRLGKLYSGEEMSSPIHKTESGNSSPKQKVLQKKMSDVDADNQSKSRKGLGGLAALAEDINHWEDDLSRSKREHPEMKNTTNRRWKAPAPRPPISTTTRSPDNSSKNSTPRRIKQQAPKPPTINNIESNAEVNKPVSPIKSPAITPKLNKSSTGSDQGTPKQIDLDPAVVEILESQGFTRTSSNTRLIYNYSSQETRTIKTAEIRTPLKIIYNDEYTIKEEEEEEEEEEKQEKDSILDEKLKLSDKDTVEKPEKLEIGNKTATFFEKQPLKPIGSPSKTNMKGPNVANRAAIFEAACSPNKNSNKDPALLSLAERKALFEKNKGKAPIPKAPISLAPLSPLGKPKNGNNEIKSTNMKDNKQSAKIVASIAKNKSTSSPQKNKEKPTDNSNIKIPNKFPSSRPPIRKDDNSSYRIPAGEPGGIASKVAALFQNKSTIGQQQIEYGIREQRQKEMDILLNRFHNNKQILETKVDSSYHSQSDSDNEQVPETNPMILLTSPQANTLNDSSSSSSFDENTPRSGSKRSNKVDSPKVKSALGKVKRIKVTHAKPGKLYPCLSDIEAATETENEPNTTSPTPNNSSFEDNSLNSNTTDVVNTSFGREILQTVCKNEIPKKRLIYDESTESDLSDILDDADDYLDEAVAYGVSDKSGPTPPKKSRSLSPVNNAPQPSNSFQYKNFSPRKDTPQKIQSSENNFKSPSKVVSPRKPNDEPPAYVVDGDNVLPLTHTVSFYRRQQTQGSRTPVRQVIRNPIVEESSESTKPSSNQESEIQVKIQKLVEDITRQQTIISQTSQALNLCYATPEFTGSTEQVEAEKVLLLATHRRMAAQHEIERLSVLRILHSENSITESVPLEKGSLTITNMVLPLKRDYVRALNATGGKGHHVVCLVKCAEHVQATQLVSTIATNDRNPNLELNIPGTIHLNDIYSNFTVQFEVYCLQAQEEMLPHEVKYHINNKKSHNKLTPKKAKTESRLVMPPLESPGGPQVVRSPTFALMGYVVFAIHGINRKNWTLNNSPSMSPLEGIVEMRIKCKLTLSVEHHGFLTMFEDVSGFGAWHRRWCLLKGHILSYWKYPEEEKKKTPIGSIDLRCCITKEIGPVRRDICARLHTILIETTRPAEPQDKDSLVMECKGDSTVIRHLLSADTKEEKNEWCSMFNKALTTMKINKNLK